MGCSCSVEAEGLQRKTLLWLLAINSVMFLAEALVGWISESTALLADSLDMLADASVYAIALYATFGSMDTKRTSAKVSGMLQIALGFGVFVEVVRRAITGSDPISLLMIGAGCIALIANLVCLRLIAAHRDAGVHMQASWIFSKNDVIANVGVVVAGLLVMAFDNRVPDLVVGSIVSVVVVRGGVQILRT